MFVFKSDLEIKYKNMGNCMEMFIKIGCKINNNI